MSQDMLFQATPGTVYFVGAGPGAPDLLTIRGRDLIAQADLVIYADSLVQDALTEQFGRPDARVATSSGLHLDEIMAMMVAAARGGQVVIRLHSGDPAIYGAIHEQMARLDAAGIPYEIVPGIPAALAAAAALKAELTVPEVVQTIILTRRAGRTPMPTGEDLTSLAQHGASLAIHLSVTRIKQVVDELLDGGYSPETPAAVFYKLSWPDESYVTGTLADIAAKVKAAGYTRHAIVMVSAAFDPDRQSARSNLYDEHYTHRFRRATKPAKLAEAHPAVTRSGKVVIAITKQGSNLARQLAQSLQGDCVVPSKFAEPYSIDGYQGAVLDAVARHWHNHEALVLVMPTGVAVRAIAPLLDSKAKDPAVVCLDERGQSVIPLIGGHQAGANALAQQIAQVTDGYAAITTASDVQGLPALDLLGEQYNWHTDNKPALTHVSAALVNGDSVGIYVDPLLTVAKDRVMARFDPILHAAFVDTLPELMSFSAGIIITHHQISVDAYLTDRTIIYHPRVLVAGLGCKRGTSIDALHHALTTTLQEHDLSAFSLSALATVDLKANEPGLVALASRIGLPLKIISQDDLRQLEHMAFSTSAALEKFAIPGVAEPCAVAVSGGTIIVGKRVFDACTVAVAIHGDC